VGWWFSVAHRWRFAQLADRIFIAYISAQSISINCYLIKIIVMPKIKTPSVLKILKYFLQQETLCFPFFKKLAKSLGVNEKILKHLLLYD